MDDNQVVYVIAEYKDDEPTGYVKIGKSATNQMKNRRDNLQTGNPRELRIDLAEQVPNAFQVETLMRQNPRLQRVVGGGKEWYRIPQDADPYRDFLAHFVRAVRQVRGF